MADGSPPHTVKSYDDDLKRLRSLIEAMGALCEAQIAASIAALVNRDDEAAKAIVAADDRLDALEAQAEALAITIIALRAPMADDLREIVAALKISSILERIGDYAKNIAKRSSAIARSVQIEPLVIVAEMGRLVARMVADVLAAYSARDVGLAAEIRERDQAVDDLYNSLFRSLLTFMMESPHHITPSTHLLFVAKNLERIGDHATNIAELVHYSATGEALQDRPKRDDTAFAAPDQVAASRS